LLAISFWILSLFLCAHYHHENYAQSAVSIASPPGFWFNEVSKKWADRAIYYVVDEWYCEWSDHILNDIVRSQKGSCVRGIYLSCANVVYWNCTWWWQWPTHSVDNNSTSSNYFSCYVILASAWAQIVCLCSVHHHQSTTTCIWVLGLYSGTALVPVTALATTFTTITRQQ